MLITKIQNPTFYNILEQFKTQFTLLLTVFNFLEQK